MAYIKVSIIIYKTLGGHSAHNDEVIVGSNRSSLITKEFVTELFRKMVTIFRLYNRRVRKEGKE